MEGELIFLDFLYRLHFHGLDKLMVCVSKLGDHGSIWFFIALLLVAFLPKERKWWAAQIIIALALNGLLVNTILKPLIGRTRPFAARPELLLLLPAPGDSSFPSGHTSSSFAAAVALFLQDKRMGIPALLFAALMGLSRMYLYVHYPTDVLAGVLFGITCGLFSESLMKVLGFKTGNKKK